MSHYDYDDYSNKTPLNPVEIRQRYQDELAEKQRKLERGFAVARLILNSDEYKTLTNADFYAEVAQRANIPHNIVQRVLSEMQGSEFKVGKGYMVVPLKPKPSNIEDFPEYTFEINSYPVEEPNQANKGNSLTNTQRALTTHNVIQHYLDNGAKIHVELPDGSTKEIKFTK